MSYLFELRMSAGAPAYVVADADSREEALAQVREELATDDDDEDEVVILAVHTMH